MDPERVAVVIGNSIGGEKHYTTNLRIQLPEFTRELARSAAFAELPAPTRDLITAETTRSFLAQIPEINEDTMPGELANILAGRIANLFNFRGPSFITDAACASALAAITAASEGLATGQFDAAIAGGVDRNMNVAAFVKFCKIGALSATGTRPFDAGADGFVMAEGAGLFVLKRLADAERDGDRIYAVLLGIAGSSDGRGKGITAPNPVGQRLAVERAWRNAGVDPSTASAVEAHGTSTRVGDASELESLNAVFGRGGVAPGSIALGSVKSNVGHLKSAAGARRHAENDHGAARPCPPAQPELPRPEPQRRLGGLAVQREYGAARVAAASLRRAARRRQRVRLRRHQLPRRARGVRPGPVPERPAAVRGSGPARPGRGQDPGRGRPDRA